MKALYRFSYGESYTSQYNPNIRVICLKDEQYPGWKQFQFEQFDGKWYPIGCKIIYFAGQYFHSLLINYPEDL